VNELGAHCLAATFPGRKFIKARAHPLPHPEARLSRSRRRPDRVTSKNTDR